MDDHGTYVVPIPWFQKGPCGADILGGELQAEILCSRSSCKLQSERSLTELRPGPKDRLLAGNLASTVQHTSTQPIVMTHL